MGVVGTSCGNDNHAGFDCVAEGEGILNKLSVYTEDDSNANCAALKNS